MRILDSTAINYIFLNNITLRPADIFWITDDIQEEAGLVAFIHSKALPKNVLPISENPNFDAIIYYRNYQIMLNKHAGRSFSNMTGFGDISILAAVQTFVESRANPPQIPGMEEKIEVYVGDKGLIKRLNKEFSSVSRFSIIVPSNLPQV